MADLTVSTTVDTFMQAADALAARTAIGAAAIGDIGYGAVANFAALPSAAANSGKTYFVSAAQGVIWINRKPAGLYTSDGAAWNYDADQTDAYLAGLTPTAGQLPVGDGTNFVTKSVSGDATLASSGALTIAANAVTNAKAAQMASYTVKVNATGSAANATDLAMAASTFLARLASGDIVAATVAQVKTLLAYVIGDIGSLGTGVATQLGRAANGTDGTAIGFRGIPTTSKSADYTFADVDCGTKIYHPSADTTARTFTLDFSVLTDPANFVVTIINDASAGVVTVAVSNGALVLAGAGSTGSRTLAANGIATITAMTTARSQINGTGLT